MIEVKLTGLRRFQQQVEGNAKRTTTTATRAFRSMIKKMNRRLIFGTPIDTGRARASWVASNGSPDYGYVRERPPYPEGGGPKTYGETILRKANAVASKATLTQPYYMTNSVPYIRKLEYDSHSKQAPQGWIRATIAEAKRDWIYRFNASIGSNDEYGGEDE